LLTYQPLQKSASSEVADKSAILPVVALLEEAIAAHRLVVRLIKSNEGRGRTLTAVVNSAPCSE